MLLRGVLTLADLVAEVEQLGGDPATTRFAINDEEAAVSDETFAIEREAGLMLVRFSNSWDHEDERS